MWSDSETARDFLNFSSVSDTVAEIIVQAQEHPISIGVSGAWGVGKSSMIKLIRCSLENHKENQNGEFLFVEFNAWLYQGYDDARAALLEVITNALLEEATKRETGLDKVKELLRRVNWLRLAKFTTSSGLPMAFGLPPIGLLGEIYSHGKNILTGNTDIDPSTSTNGTEQDIKYGMPNLLNPNLGTSPPREIHAIRDSFEGALSEMKLKLVVLIDDLDRCLPPTTISTLEAIRLFLFLKNTAFIIAADDTMIKHAVRNHFEGVDDTLVTNYFDKLIQVPIRVPPLGTQEVRAYMIMLFIEKSTLSEGEKEEVRAKVCKQLAMTWRGCRVDRAFIESAVPQNLTSTLVSRIDTVDRLVPLMTTSPQIAGNPRLIKRFLNALSIRMTNSTALGVGVDEAVLAKMLLFERCATPAAYNKLTQAVNNDSEGKPRFLGDWEEDILAGIDVELDEVWNNQFILEWLAVPPKLADKDLRGVLYVSREHAPAITPEDRMSSDAVEVLSAILEHPEMATSMQDNLAQLPRSEITIIMDRLLEQAHQIQEWGTPPILDACLAVAVVDPTQGQRIKGFLQERPIIQIKPSLIPKIGDHDWAKDLFKEWTDSKLRQPVKNAIKRELKQHGNR